MEKHRTRVAGSAASIEIDLGPHLRYGKITRVVRAASRAHANITAPWRNSHGSRDRWRLSRRQREGSNRERTVRPCGLPLHRMPAAIGERVRNEPRGRERRLQVTFRRAKNVRSKMR